MRGRQRAERIGDVEAPRQRQRDLALIGRISPGDSVQHEAHPSRFAAHLRGAVVGVLDSTPLPLTPPANPPRPRT